MHEQFIRRAVELQRRMADEGVDLLILTDPDSIYYASGYWGYLGLEFGRPTMVVVPRAGELAVITPKMEAEMARNMTWIETVEEWMDGEDGEWMRPLGRALECHQPAVLAVERHKTPSPVSEFLRRELPRAAPADATPILDEMRMIKSPEEIAVMRQAGEVAIAMATAAEAVIAEGVPEYEVALAVIAGGTRKAAELLRGEGADRLMSPTIYNLQVMQSGHDTCMVHRRSTRRRIQRGDPVYLCFCGIANFKLYKLGFDREYFVGVVTDEQARIYETALRAQAAALAVDPPGRARRGAACRGRGLLPRSRLRARLPDGALDRLLVSGEARAQAWRAHPAAARDDLRGGRWHHRARAVRRPRRRFHRRHRNWPRLPHALPEGGADPLEGKNEAPGTPSFLQAWRLASGIDGTSQSADLSPSSRATRRSICHRSSSSAASGPSAALAVVAIQTGSRHHVAVSRAEAQQAAKVAKVGPSVDAMFWIRSRGTGDGIAEWRQLAA